jgi:predicted MFS family arabinose efflux permease
MPSDATAAPLRRNRSLWLCFAVTMVAVGNVSGVSPAFPRMVEVFAISRAEVGWLVTAYSVPGIVSAPVIGVLADRWGYKRVLVPAILTFSVAGASCALVRDFGLLLALRAVQGMAAAPLVGLSITIISALYDGPTRNRLIGYNSTALSVGTAVYPLLGGALATLAWYWPFAMPLLATPVGLGVALGLRVPDGGGAPPTWADYRSVAQAALRDRRIRGLLALNAGFFTLLFGIVFTYVPELLEAQFQASSAAGGLVLAALSVGAGVASTQLGRLAARTTLPRILAGSFVGLALALAAMPWAPSPGAVAGCGVLFGGAQGVNQPAQHSHLSALAPDASRGVVLSINMTVLRVGQGGGPLVAGAVLAWGGLTWMFVAGAVWALGLAGLALWSL